MSHFFASKPELLLGKLVFLHPYYYFQDIEDFKKWNWNSTLEVATSDLTGTGYEELYDIAKRLREKYPHLLEGDKDDFYFRCTNEQRTITSAIAFAHGWSEGTSLALSVDGPWDRDDVIRVSRYLWSFGSYWGNSMIMRSGFDVAPYFFGPLHHLSSAH